MLLCDLLYYANSRFEINKHSIVEFRIFLNPTDFKNILEECILLKPPNTKFILNVDNKCIMMKNFSIFQRNFYPYQDPNSKLHDGTALFEYDFQNYWEQRVQILTESERIIKNIIE